MEKISNNIKSLLSVKPDFIYWQKGSNFNRALCTLGRNKRRERLIKIKLLQRALFSYFDGINEDIYLTPEPDFDNKDGAWLSWFTYFPYCGQNMKGNVFYGDILNEANKSGIYLKTQNVIEYKENRALAEKLFRGNNEYLTSACFSVPALDLAVRPLKCIELIVFSKEKGKAYGEFVKHILSFSEDLAFSRESFGNIDL